MSEPEVITDSRPHPVEDEKEILTQAENLEREIMKPFPSLDDAASVHAQMKMRLWLLMLRGFLKVAARNFQKGNPGNEQMWRHFEKLMNTDIVGDLRKAFSWQEAMASVAEAKMLIKKMLEEKKMTPKQAELAMEYVTKMEDNLKVAKSG